jgi:hypothetical protein
MLGTIESRFKNKKSRTLEIFASLMFKNMQSWMLFSSELRGLAMRPKVFL